KACLTAAVVFSVGARAPAQIVDALDGSNIYWQNRKEQAVSVGPLLFWGRPTGPCLPSQLAVDTTTGIYYSCDAGQWILATNANPVFSNLTVNFKFTMGGMTHTYMAWNGTPGSVAIVRGTVGGRSEIYISPNSKISDTQ